MQSSWLRYHSMNKTNRVDAHLIRTTRVSIGGMLCGTCARHVNRALGGLSGVVHVDVDLRKNETTVEHLPEWVGESAILAAINDAGYPARIIVRETGDADPLARSVPGGCASGCCCGPRPAV